MGRYTDGLFKKGRVKESKAKMVFSVEDDDIDPDSVRLVECAIERDGILHQGFKSHGEIRAALGDKDAYADKPRPGDTEGFITSEGEFVSRRKAMVIGIESGQCQSMSRDLLSSDINW